MCAFERRNDALESREKLKRLERFGIVRFRIRDPTDVVQVCVLGSYRRIVQPCRYRMRSGYLSVLVLQHVAACSLQDTRPPSAKSSRVLAKLIAAPARFDADHPHAIIGEEFVKQANRIAS